MKSLNHKVFLLFIFLFFVLSFVSVNAQVIETKVSSTTELNYSGDVSDSDLLDGIVPATTGWNLSSAPQLTDGVHGDSYDLNGVVEGAWTTVGATATYDLGTGANGTGYDLNSIVSIADWQSAAYGNQGWTIEVQPVGGVYTTLYTVDYPPLVGDVEGATKVVLASSSGIVATGIEKIKITANSVANTVNNLFVWRELDVFGVDTPVNCVSSNTQLTYQGDVSTSDLLHGITPTNETGWNNTNGASFLRLTDGLHGAAGGAVEGAWTTVGATATYDLGLGANGTGYDLNSIVSIADWNSAGFGNQNWTIEVQPVGGSFTTLLNGYCPSLGSTDAGTTKVIEGDGSTILASGIQYIRITANSVNGGANGGAFVWRELDVFGVDTPANCVSSNTQLTYQGDVSTSDLLHGITPTNETGWNNTNGASFLRLTDGVHGDDFATAGSNVEGAWTTVGATATYDLGLGPNGTGYDLNYIVSIADWESAGFGNQNWTIEVQPVGGSFTTLLNGYCQSLGSTDAGTTKVIVGDGSTILASGIQYIRITANSVNGGANGGAFVWRELDVFGVATPPNCDFSLTPLTYQGDVSNSDLLTGITPTNVSGWDTNDGASVSQLTDGVHGDDFAAAGNTVEGAFTTVGATITYALGLGANGLGYDLNSVVSIADWFESGYGDQSWTIEVQPVGGSYISLNTGNCQPLTDAGTTKVVVGDGTTILATGIQNIRITANAVNGAGFVWRELDVFGVATPAVSCVLNIMPMGDSITAGYTDNPGWTNHQFMFGYRADLYYLLANSGIDVQYMGSSAEPWNNAFGDPSHGGTYTPDPDLRDISQDNHHGYGGKTASFLNSGIASWLAAEEPDIILLKIGTNSQDTGGLNILVNYITTNYPDIHVIVAQIMPKINYQAGIVNYNNYIKNTMVPAYQAQGKNVTTVDLYTPFLTNPSDPTSIDPSLFSNGINHPDADGYNLMALAWQIAINDLGLTGCTDPPPFNICTAGATAGTVTANDPDADGINNVCDLDDDNDGILDSDEGYLFTCEDYDNPVYSNPNTGNTNFNNMVGSTFGNVETESGATTLNIFRVNGSPSVWDKGPDNAYNGNQYLDIASSDEYVVLRFTSPGNTTIDATVQLANLASIDPAYEDWTGSIELVKDDGSGDVLATGNEVVFIKSMSDEYWYDCTLSTYVADAGDYYIRINQGDYGVSDQFCVYLTSDIDGDTIPNHLDLDTDGDGCADAIEGDGSYTSTDLVNSAMDGGNTGPGYIGPFSGPIIQNLGITVDGDGVPTAAASQGVGDSIDGNNRGDCKCDSGGADAPSLNN